MQNPATPCQDDPAPDRDRGDRGAAGHPILSARFAVPAVPDILVRRPPLLERLTAGVRLPLTLVSGPAGAGKSVLAAHWTSRHRGPGPVAWLRVEPDDSPETFWAHLRQALVRQGVRPSGEDGTTRPAEAGGRPALGRLAEGLARASEPVVLVLDQFDAQVAPEVADALAFLIRNAAPGLRLVLTGRSEPLLPLHRYRAAGELAEIRTADLRFSREDTAALLRNHGLEAHEEDVRLLTDRTEGWAAGLRLCALAMQRATDPKAFVRDFAADRSMIADYLLTEVLQAYPQATQDLLLRASIADRIHPDLADVLTGGHDSAWTLAALERANAFVEAVEGTGWYRMHRLFAEVLRAQLRHRRPGLEPRLRRRAARWFADHGHPAEAGAQAVAAGDWPLAATTLTGLGAGALAAGDVDGAEAGLTAAVEACEHLGTEQPHQDALASLALAELLQGRLRRAETHAREALELAEHSGLPSRQYTALGRLALAGAAAEHDDLAAARQHLDLAAACAGPGLHAVAAVEAAVIGSRLATAAGALDHARAVLDEAGGPLLTGSTAPTWALDELAVAESAVHLARGDSVAALAVLDDNACGRPEHAVARARALLAAGRDGSAMEALADLPSGGTAAAPSQVQAALLRVQAAMRAGDVEAARRLLAHALALARPERLRRLFVESGPTVRGLLHADPHLVRAHGWLSADLLGGLRTAAAERLPAMIESLTERERDVLNQAARMLSTEEIAAELYVSANTVKTHLKSAFRKLCVTRRSEAVHRARQLGLL